MKIHVTNKNQNEVPVQAYSVNKLNCYPKPNGPYDTSCAWSTHRDVYQYSCGIYIPRSSIHPPRRRVLTSPPDVRIPINVICGQYKNEFFFEEVRLQEANPEYIDGFTRFSSEFILYPDGLPHALPSSFIEIEQHLFEQHTFKDQSLEDQPLYRQKIHDFLIYIFTEQCLYDGYSDCIGSCEERAEELYIQAKQRAQSS